nr:retrotransposon protein, putative, Ty1-copia subclass [Tanacetum cinerariifolium]
MTRKSFPRRPERAIDLLGIIHTNLCGPLRHVSRQGASYFITFTDDYSRYGYVYLLKHKHELTPPYTPQHNGMFKRRNRTLLDMVRSMMNLTTLPLSFWDYALESVTRIPNMVPTKKVDKTPYELDIKLDNSKRGHISMQERIDLNKTQGASTPKEVKRMQNVPYASAVGSIMYVVRCTRPDVAFAQNITSQFQQNPEPRVDCYCDAGFETDIDDMKSLTGYVSF